MAKKVKATVKRGRVSIEASGDNPDAVLAAAEHARSSARGLLAETVEDDDTSHLSNRRHFAHSSNPFDPA